MKALGVVLVLVGCASQQADRPLADERTGAPEGKATAPEEAPVEQKAVLPRQDLSKLKPGFPATAPKELKIIVKTDSEVDAAGLGFQYTLLEFEHDHEKFQVAMKSKKDYADLLELRSEIKPEKIKWERKGKDGALAFADVFTSQGRERCFLRALEPKGRLLCWGSASCAEIEKYADVCASIVHTGGERVELHGPEIAFGLIEVDANGSKVAWKFAKAIIDRDAEPILAMWSPKGVTIHGRRVTLASAKKQLGKHADIVRLLKIPCPPRMENDEGCFFAAGSPEEDWGDEHFAVVLHDSEDQGGPKFRAVFAKDAKGSWRLDSIEENPAY